MTGLPLAVVCLAGFTAGCSGHDPAAGSLTGYLYGVGGPAPGSPRPWPGTVTVAGSGIHRDVPVSASGKYTVTVPAGRYTITGHSPFYGGGSYVCSATRVATVTGGHTTRADVLCQMM